MLLVVTGVGLLVHVYSLGYMHGDARFERFFAYLNLFLFSMLVLVLGSNLLTLFLGWELVGLSSYLLIGFWFEKREYASAAKKAFITNRVGDVSFMVAMFLTFATFGTLGAKAVVRDAGRVLDLPYTKCDQLSKLIPHNPADPWTLERALRDAPHRFIKRHRL